MLNSEPGFLLIPNQGLGDEELHGTAWHCLGENSG